MFSWLDLYCTDPAKYLVTARSVSMDGLSVDDLSVDDLSVLRATNCCPAVNLVCVG